MARTNSTCTSGVATHAEQVEIGHMWCALSQMQLSNEQCKYGSMIRLCGLGEQSASGLKGNGACSKGARHLEEAFGVALKTRTASLRITGTMKACHSY